MQTTNEQKYIVNQKRQENRIQNIFDSKENICKIKISFENDLNKK